ncbi:hypothetical protein [Spiroplasma endosymbiont of Villa modesta]|uniref:hypothetical protein n=1 Tax=Spiroplasma endosymbiont of Villa modesta TaxID=3066293 RepID=UPI00313AFDC1
MIPKINHQLIKTVWKSTGEIEKDFTQNKDLQFRVCPFTIILGAINSTETGYKPPTSIPNDYTSFSKIFTGREAIQAVWDHSYYPIQNKDNPDEAYKQLQIGDVFYGNILSDQLGITYSATPANNAFIQEQAIKNVVINIPNEKKNFNFINNIVSNLYKLYMIPEINKVINIDKSIKVDRQWYILEVASKTYNNENKELAYIQCTFSSLNDKLAHSGLAINQYVQLGAPGDPVALPALDENNNIVLDSNYLTPLPVTHCQISFYGSVKPISIALWGRDIDNNPINTKKHKYRQYPSKLLFPWQYQCSTYDPVSFQALPETNYVLTVQGQSVMDSYQDWQKVISPNYDDGATKHYEGHLRTNVEKTKNTNKVDASNRLVNYWDNNFLNGAEIEDYNYATAGNPYFQYYNKNNKKFIGNTHYNMNNNKFKQLNTINALHYFIYNPISEIPLTVRETIKINLNTIPIFGSFMNAFVGGLDIGAKLSSNLLIPQFNYINGLISAELYTFYTTLLYSSQSTNPALIPLDVFRNETPDTIQSVLGTASHMTSFTFNLTDRINLQNFNINDGSISSQGIYDSVNLGQLNGAGGKDTISLLPKENSLIPLLNEPKFTNTNILKWAIDMIDIKVVGKSNFKITFYSMPDNRNGAVNDNFSIWSGTYQTVGKASNNSRLIQNTFILANNTFKFDQPFNYPQAIQPPPLIERAHSIFIDLSNQNQYGIKNNISRTLKASLSDVYQMRPNWRENQESGKFLNYIHINVKDYGYENIDKFKDDYESMTFNFTINMNANWNFSPDNPSYTNSKSWFTPIKINLSDIGNFTDGQGLNASFQDNDTIYNNNSGNHIDMNNNWIFNIKNNTSLPISQTATLMNTERLNKI